MDKEFYKSKTLWGAMIFGAISFALGMEWISENMFWEVMRLISGIFGIYGLRDAV